MDHRHTKEGFVLFFAGFRNVVVTRMRIGVVEVHGFGEIKATRFGDEILAIVAQAD